MSSYPEAYPVAQVPDLNSPLPRARKQVCNGPRLLCGPPCDEVTDDHLTVITDPAQGPGSVPFLFHFSCFFYIVFLGTV